MQGKHCHEKALSKHNFLKSLLFADIFVEVSKVSTEAFNIKSYWPKQIQSQESAKAKFNVI